MTLTWKTEIHTTRKVNNDNSLTPVTSERYFVNTSNGRRFSFIRKPEDFNKPLSTYQEDIWCLRLSSAGCLPVLPLLAVISLVILVAQSLRLLLINIADGIAQPSITFRATLLNIGKDVVRIIFIPVTSFAHMLCIVYGIFKPLDAINFCRSLLLIYEVGVDREADYDVGVDREEDNASMLIVEDMKRITNVVEYPLTAPLLETVNTHGVLTTERYVTDTIDENILPAT